uniref:hypothetical protein n=1 Tax=Salmonella sp. TaxID=599 RepID=UPI001CD97AEB|nr:hypothetical protein [Salmonella sp.]
MVARLVSVSPTSLIDVDEKVKLSPRTLQRHRKNKAEVKAKALNKGRSGKDGKHSSSYHAPSDAADKSFTVESDHLIVGLMALRNAG